MGRRRQTIPSPKLIFNIFHIILVFCTLLQNMLTKSFPDDIIIKSVSLIMDLFSMIT